MTADVGAGGAGRPRGAGLVAHLVLWLFWVPVVVVLAVASVAIGHQAATETLPGGAFGLWCFSIVAGVLAVHLGAVQGGVYLARVRYGRRDRGQDASHPLDAVVSRGVGWGTYRIVHGVETTPEAHHPVAAWVDRWLRWVSPGLLVALVTLAGVVELT